MSGQVTITQLPNAAALTGSESVPVVQNGVTVQTTTGAISGAGALNYPFLTVGSTSGLTQARYLSATTGLSITDNGAGSTLTLNMTGAASVLNTVGTGIIVKDSASTVVNRSLTVGAGMTVSNADGVSDNPLISVNTNLQNLSSLSSVGFVAGNGSTFSELTFSGTTNQINIASGDGSSGGPVVSIASNPVLPGTGSVTVPSGTTAQRSGTNGALRYNTTNNSLEAYISGAWATLGTSGSISIVTANGFAGTVTNPSAPNITLSTTITGVLKGNGTAISAAVSGTDYAPATSGSSILYGNGSGGFSNVTVGSGLSFSSGTLSSTSSGGTVSSVGLSAPALFTVTNSPVTSAGTLTLSYSGTALPVANGGTGQTTYTDGQLLIGNTSGNTLTKSTLTAGSGITITNGNGSITIASTGGGSGTVTSVGLSAPALFTVTNSPVTSSGTLTLSYSGTALPVANGGTGITSYTAGDLLYASATATISKLAIGTSNYVLTSSGTAPQYVAQSTLSVGSASTATTATNVTGGAAGSLVYQTAAATTSTLALGTSGYILTAGASAPTYIQTLPIANGGTNATTASAARTNLSAAQSGTNTDITSIALTTGTVSTAPSANTDIVNKLYADSIASGINFHAAAQWATTANLGTVTYNNGSSGVGATITNAGTQAILAIDGHTFDGTDVTNATRVLVKNQTTQSQNGVYTVTNQGTSSTNWVLTRATDYDTSGTGTNEVDQGDFILVINGTANANTSWVQQTPLPITIGTTNIVFIQFGAASGGVSSFTAGSTGFTPSTATTGAVTLAGTLNVANGGTGQTSYTDGQLLIGNSTGNTLTKSTLTAGSGITITNAGGSITIASTGGGGGVSSFSAGTTGFTPNTATTGAVTLAGTLNIANGGTGSTTLAGASIATYTGTETLTNKRIDPRVTSAASASSLTPSIGSADIYAYTFLAANLTINAPGGSPVDGDKLMFRFLDNGTARTLTWDTTYTSIVGSAFTNTFNTTAGKTTYVGCIYNANNTRWDVIAVTTQA